MTNGFDVMAVGIKNERAIVMFVIMRARPRLSVVSAADGKRGLVKLIYGCPVLGGEGDVSAGL
jgi:hypothetical protein